jgi:hypothetical protein
VTGYYQVEPDEVAVVQRFGTWLILSTNSELLKFLKSDGGGPTR